MLSGNAHIREGAARQHDSRTTLQAPFVVWVTFTVATFGFGIGFYGPAVFFEILRTAKDRPLAAIPTAITAHFLAGAAIVLEVQAALLTQRFSAPSYLSLASWVGRA
jgi:hypothetical protein